jgi:hypothetical protein
MTEAEEQLVFETLVRTLVDRAAQVQDEDFSNVLRDELIRNAQARFPAALGADHFLIMVGALLSVTSAVIETWANQTGSPRGPLYATATEILAAIFESRNKLPDPAGGAPLH